MNFTTLDSQRIDQRTLKKFARTLRRRRERSHWDFAALMITDMFQGDSLVLLDSKSAAVGRKILPCGSSGELWRGCVSRKKQFLPEILRRLSDEDR